MIQAPTSERDFRNIQEIKNQELFGFVVARNITDAKLFNPYSAVPYASIKTIA